MIFLFFIDYFDCFFLFVEFRFGKMSYYVDVVGFFIDFESVDEFELFWS